MADESTDWPLASERASIWKYKTYCQNIPSALDTMYNLNLFNKRYTLKRPKGSSDRLCSKRLHFSYLIPLYFIIPLLFSNAFRITQSPHVKAIQKDDFWLCLGEGQEKLKQSSLLLCWRQKGSGDIALLGPQPGPVSPAGKPKGSRLYVLTALSKQLPESALSAFRRRRAGKKEDVQQKDVLQLPLWPHRLKW